MATIRISERAGLADGRNAVVTFDGQGEYPIAVANPFSAADEQDLEWYFEDHLRWPFLETVRAQAAAASVRTYGEALFQQVFGANPQAVARYAVARQSEGVTNLRFEIAGSPAFHQYHWEALKDPELARAFALEAPMVRRNLNPPTLQADVRSSPTINLLIVVARPGGRTDVGYRTISQPLVDALHNARLRVKVEILRPGTYRALVEHLEDVRDRHGLGYYHVIHFDLHGALLSHDEFAKGCATDQFSYQARYARGDVTPYPGRRAYLAFAADAPGKSDLAEAGEVAGLLQSHQVPVAVLNACQSGKQVGLQETSLGSRLMQAGVQLVVAMGYSVTVSAAERMMTALYGRLFADNDLASSIRRARLELWAQKSRRAYFNQSIDLEDWVLPVVYINRDLNLQPRPMTPEETEAFYRARDRAHPFPKPTYGFHGRDVDVLEIENRLLKPDGNLLLIRGMGGAGKTTLLHHLAAWWQTTQFVDRVLAFAYDLKAWNRQQILREIAEKLLPRAEFYTRFEPLSLDVQQAMIVDELRANRHLLLLDNLESITGSPLSIPNTLPAEEQHALRSFLTKLQGGKTLVLLGSRGGEAWLAPGTFGDNVYDLPGLDPEAASTLAERILEKIGATKYRSDNEFRRLLRLLDGFPLPIEVILPNLARQSPKEILDALREGLESVDRQDVQGKTESILKCIDYSFGNLAPGDQDLLSGLAWFSGVCHPYLLSNYTECLRDQPSLSHLSLDRFADVLRQAMTLGLLSTHPMIPGFLQLQPTLPYFLRTRLNDPSRRAIREATRAGFVDLYTSFCLSLIEGLRAAEPPRKIQARTLIQAEFENIAASLELAVASRKPMVAQFLAMSLYLDEVQDHDRGLKLALGLIGRLKDLAPEDLAGTLGFQLVMLFRDTADRLLQLNRFAEARRAIRFALQSLGKNTMISDDDKLAFRVSILHILAVVEHRQGHFEQAERRYKRVWTIYKKYRGSEDAQADIVYELAGLSKDRGQFDKSKRLYHRAIRLYRTTSNDMMIGQSYLGLGTTHNDQGNQDRARLCFLRAGHIFQKHNQLHMLGRALVNLGAIELHKAEARGRGYSRRALRLGIQLDCTLRDFVHS